MPLLNRARKFPSQILDEPQIGWTNRGEDPLNTRGFQPEHPLEQAREHGTVVSENGIVPVLEKVCLVDFDLFADDAATIDAASHHPIDAAMPVIGAPVTVLTEGAAKFRDHNHNSLSPSRGSNLFREAR